MKSSYWRTFVLFSLTLVLMSTAMDAQAARRSSFAGNQFIDDPDDMFAFPQLMMKYTNRVIFDMAPNGNSGNGSLIFGDNTVWNFNTGRGDIAVHISGKRGYLFNIRDVRKGLKRYEN